MDLMMPVMNGFEFREQQLSDDRIARIPFVTYSAVVNLAKNAEHLQADGYFEKPIDMTAMLGLVQRLCPHGHP
jgi:CheY-like chemotaxis protein